MKLNWKGKTACLIASGPSLEKWQVDYVLKSSAKIIAINNNWQICPAADVLYGCDAKWWRAHKGAESFWGHKFSLENSGYSDVYQLHDSGNSGIDFLWPNIKTGKNGGYQALNLAVHFGCRKIILIGYDMQHTNGKKHWHPDHPKKLNNAQCVAIWPQYFKEAALILKEKGIEVINCTIETALKCFKQADIRDVL